MRYSVLCHLLAYALPALAASSSDDSKGSHAACTIRSPTSGAFFDLNPLHVTLPSDPKKVAKDARTESWPARGYDYGANFTINFCGPVVEDLKDVVGIEESMWKNVSAFYEFDGKTYSIGCAIFLSLLTPPTKSNPSPVNKTPNLYSAVANWFSTTQAAHLAHPPQSPPTQTSRLAQSSTMTMTMTMIKIRTRTRTPRNRQRNPSHPPPAARIPSSPSSAAPTPWPP